MFRINNLYFQFGIWKCSCVEQKTYMLSRTLIQFGEGKWRKRKLRFPLDPLGIGELRSQNLFPVLRIHNNGSS